MIRWLREEADMSLYTTMEEEELLGKMDYLLDEINELPNQRQVDQATRFISHIIFELQCRLEEE